MRETYAGKDPITWSTQHRRPFNDSAFILRSPAPPSFCALLILNLLVTVARLGVGEAHNCCGMRINTSKCWTHLACACEDCRASQGQGDEMSNSFKNYKHYRLEFCSSFPLNRTVSAEFFRNKTFCQKQATDLQEADRKACKSYNDFKGILERIDCGTNWTGHTYSATSTCLECLEAYKDWICFTRVSEAILVSGRDDKPKGSCLSFLCQRVLQKCPYLPPTVPSDDWDNVVQIGYSAFNCLEEKEWKNQYQDSEQCLDSDLMKKSEDIEETTVVTSDSATNSSKNGNR